MPSVGGLRGGDVFLPLFPWLQEVVEEGHAEGERVGLIVTNGDLARLGGLNATVASFFVAGDAADALDAADSAIRGVGVPRRPRHRGTSVLGCAGDCCAGGWWWRSVERFTKEEVVVSSVVGGLDSREPLHRSIDFWLGAYSVAWRC